MKKDIIESNVLIYYNTDKYAEFGSGTNLNLNKRYDIIITSFHLFRDLFNEKDGFDTGNIGVIFFKYKKNNYLYSSKPQQIHKVLKYDKDLDLVLFDVKKNFKTKKIGVYNKELKLFDKVYNAGVSPLNFPLFREGILIAKSDDENVYNLNATFGDSGSGIIKGVKNPKLATIVTNIFESQDGIPFQYLTMSPSEKNVYEFINDYFNKG